MSATEFKALLGLRAPKSAYALLEGSTTVTEEEEAPIVTNEKPKKKSKKELKAEEEAKKKAAEEAKKAADAKREAEWKQALEDRKKETERIQRELAERKSSEEKEAADLAAWVPFDWRDKGVVGPVKNQGGCGSCWSFGTIATVESALAIKAGGGPVPVLSEQSLVSCDTSNSGCNGGWYTGAYNWLTANGLYDQAAYPYEARATACKASTVAKSTKTIKGHTSAYGSDAKILSQLKKGPAAIAIDANNLQFFGNGIMRAANCTDRVNHAVVLVGIGKDAATSTNFWIIRNSWGSTWGDKGYYRQEATGANVCGIHIGAYVPKLE
jgi:C1A family cysteine protease